MNITFLDVILFLSLFYLIMNILYIQIKKNPEYINFISDDDIYIINNNILSMQDKLSDDNELSDNENKKEIANKNEQSDFMNNDNEEILNSFDKLNDRYNRKLNRIPKEADLINFLDNKTLNNNINEDMNFEKLHFDKQNLFNNDKSLDFKIFAKSNKSQKLFKDAKTIAGRFNKDSIIDDYKSELDYYEKLRTPWWVENI